MNIVQRLAPRARGKKQPVLTSHIDDITKNEWYASISAAASKMGLHPSTVARAASGDRGCLTAGNRIVSYI
jgi:hypothetical protein